MVGQFRGVVCRSYRADPKCLLSSALLASPVSSCHESLLFFLRENKLLDYFLSIPGVIDCRKCYLCVRQMASSVLHVCIQFPLSRCSCVSTVTFVLVCVVTLRGPREVQVDENQLIRQEQRECPTLYVDVA